MARIRRRDGRADEGDGLENHCGPKGHRGFESHSLRHLNTTIAYTGRCRSLVDRDRLLSGCGGNAPPRVQIPASPPCFTCPRSSIGQSVWLRTRRLQIRILPRVLKTRPATLDGTGAGLTLFGSAQPGRLPGTSSKESCPSTIPQLSNPILFYPSLISVCSLRQQDTGRTYQRLKLCEILVRAG